jgi:hypothetical protein
MNSTLGANIEYTQSSKRHSFLWRSGIFVWLSDG